MEKEKIAILEKLLVRMEYGDLNEKVSQGEVRALRRALSELMQETTVKKDIKEDADVFKKYLKKKDRGIDVSAEDFNEFLQRHKENKE